MLHKRLKGTTLQSIERQQEIGRNSGCPGIGKSTGLGTVVGAGKLFFECSVKVRVEKEVGCHEEVVFKIKI